MPRQTPYSLPDIKDVDFVDIPEGEDVAAAYENGYVGSAYSGEAEEQLQSAVEEEGGKFQMQDNASASGFSGQGAGKIILIHKEIEKMGWGAKIGYPNQACGDCLQADSIVTLADGKKAIKDIEIGDKVKTPSHGDQEVKSLFRKSFDGSLFTVGFDSSKVQCTPDHLFLTPSKAWIAAEDLKKGDAIVGESEVLHVSSVSSEKWSGTVYCFEVEEAHCFFANGAAVHNCVSHGTAKAMGYTLVTGITRGGKTKPETNGIEAKMWPIASETHYWYRAKSSDGWYASKSLEMSKKNTGIVIRADIKGACDIRSYSKATAHCYGSKAPPADVKAQLDDNPVLTYSKCSSFEEICDALSAGYGCQTDGSEGFSKQCNDDGVAKRSGSWSHSMSVSGCISTPEFKAKYNTAGALLIQNSWGAFNTNKHSKVMGTDTGIPAGSFFALWEDIKKRSYYIVSNVTTWENRKLPSWNLDELI